jgi:hypothetical protein
LTSFVEFCFNNNPFFIFFDVNRIPPKKIMKKKHLLLSFFAVAALATFNIKQANSKVASPPAGSSGDPVTNATCIQSGCHVGTATAPPQGGVALAIGTGNPTTALNSSFQYTPGTVYNIAFSITSNTGRYGFQIVPLTGSNAMAGSYTVTSASTTQINSLAGRQYMGHKSASSIKNWLFKWTAPAAGTGDVTFYYTYNTADGNNVADASDQVYKSTITITEANGTGINDIAANVSDLTIFPNPINNEFGLSFNLLQANQVNAQLFTLNGQMAKELINAKMNEGAVNQQFDISGLPSGIYVVKVNVGQSSVSKKIIKL